MVIEPPEIVNVPVISSVAVCAQAAVPDTITLPLVGEVGAQVFVEEPDKVRL